VITSRSLSHTLPGFCRAPGPAESTSVCRSWHRQSRRITGFTTSGSRSREGAGVGGGEVPFACCRRPRAALGEVEGMRPSEEGFRCRSCSAEGLLRHRTTAAPAGRPGSRIPGSPRRERSRLRGEPRPRQCGRGELTESWKIASDFRRRGVTDVAVHAGAAASGLLRRLVWPKSGFR
jgi:hypothetical protein